MRLARLVELLSSCGQIEDIDGNLAFGVDEFDNTSSTTSTLLQIVAQDYPGLLREVAKTFAEQGCNIEVALIDTEGEIAIDVFYLTAGGKKLDEPRQAHLREALEAALKGVPA